MKKGGSILSVFFLVVIYCFAIAVTTLPIKFGIKNNTTYQEQLLYSTSTDFHFNTSQVGKLSNGAHHFQTLSIKKTIFEFYKIAKTIDRLLKTEYAQYFKYSTNFLIDFKQSRLAFPFHYFW